MPAGVFGVLQTLLKRIYFIELIFVVQSRAALSRGDHAEQHAEQTAPDVSVLRCCHCPQQRVQIRAGVHGRSAQV